MAPALDRDCQLHVLAAAGWSIDQRLAFGITPGRLKIPQLNIQKGRIILNASPIHFAGCLYVPLPKALVTCLQIPFPNNKAYTIYRQYSDACYWYYEDCAIYSLDTGIAQLLEGTRLPDAYSRRAKPLDEND